MALDNTLTELREDSTPALTVEEAAENFAHDVGLRYVHSDEPGLRRLRRGKSFRYIDAKNKTVTCEKTLNRIKTLVIPPAWEDVWICAHAQGHLQATGRDQRDRKQYRYHAEWSRARNENKFEHLLVFGRSLPQIRRELESALSQPGLTREKVLAATVQIMELTKIRIGNDIYASENDSYGLTTMLHEHTDIHGSTVKFKFKGKSGIHHEVKFSDPRLSRIIRRCQDLPGEELFGYEDNNGQFHRIDSHDVNEYLRQISGHPISAKDFRTWGGTLKALEVVISQGPSESSTQTARKKRALAIIREVSEHLRNTVAVCRKYYVHPMVFALDANGYLHKLARSRRMRKSQGLSREEVILMDLLQSPKEISNAMEASALVLKTKARVSAKSRAQKKSKKLR